MNDPYLIPQIETDELAIIQIDDREWTELEKVLQLHLDAMHRTQLTEAIAFFIHMVRLKDQLPTPRQYRKKLLARIQEIEEAAKALGALIQPPKPANGSSSRPPVVSDSEHVRFIFHRAFPKDMTASLVALHRLMSVCHRLKLAVRYEQSGENPRGRDGQYELKILLRDVLVVGRNAGDDLRLPAHSISDATEAEYTATSPIYEFAMEVLALIDISAPKLIAERIEDITERTIVLERLQAYVRKTPGALNELLYEMRTDIQEA
jgi:hypothetical protein